MFYDNPYTIIDEAQAAEIALQSIPGTVVDIDLEDDDGMLIYEVDIIAGNRRYEVIINAYTGEVLGVDYD